MPEIEDRGSSGPEGDDRFRQYKGAAGKLITFVGAALPLYAIFFWFGVFQSLGLYILFLKHLAVFLGMMIILIFLLVPASKKAMRERLPWYDGFLIIMTLAGTGYVVVFGDRLAQYELITADYEILLGIISIVVVLEAARRVTGYALVVIPIIFIFYAFFSNYFPGPLAARGYSLERVIQHLYIVREGIFGLPTELAAGVILMFIFLGQLLYFAGGGRWFVDTALSLAGHIRGGPAKVAVIGSALMGMITGSAAANAATTGILTIPMMKRTGYRPEFAAAVEAVASTGGQFMPPIMGISAFVIAELLGIPYVKVAVASLLPAVLYFLAVFCQVDLEAAKGGLKGLSRKDMPSFKHVLPSGWQYLFPLTVLVYCLAVLDYSAATAAIYASVILIVVAMFKKETRFGPRKMLQALEATTRGMFPVVTACSAAGIVIGIVSLTGLGLKLSSMLVTIAGSEYLALALLTALVSIVLGMGVPVLPAYIMLAILVAPALISVGTSALAAHLFIFYFAALSFITPPVCPAVYVTAAIGKSSVMRTGFQAVRLGIVAYIVPFMFLYHPALLLKGPPAEIVIATISSIIGVVALSIAVEGYMFEIIRWLFRIPLFAGGVMMIVPGWLTDIAGVGIIAGLALVQKIKK